jgi:hypothetical protein
MVLMHAPFETPVYTTTAQFGAIGSISRPSHALAGGALTPLRAFDIVAQGAGGTAYPSCKPSGLAHLSCDFPLRVEIEGQ